MQLCIMPTRHTAHRERSSLRAGGGRTQSDHQRPSGRHGGPSAAPPLRSRTATASLTSECYIINHTYEQALRMTRRALSKHGLQLLRECNVTSRFKAEGAARECRVLYVADPALLFRAISADASAGLWLPLPVVIAEDAKTTRILFPCEAIVRDRASLLGVRELVHDFYACLTAAIKTVGKCEHGAIFSDPISAEGCASGSTSLDDHSPCLSPA
jgi:uncharacterized protein (DUF302 family)